MDYIIIHIYNIYLWICLIYNTQKQFMYVTRMEYCSV